MNIFAFCCFLGSTFPHPSTCLGFLSKLQFTLFWDSNASTRAWFFYWKKFNFLKKRKKKEKKQVSPLWFNSFPLRPNFWKRLQKNCSQHPLCISVNVKETNHIDPSGHEHQCSSSIRPTDSSHLEGAGPAWLRNLFQAACTFLFVKRNRYWKKILS